MSMANKLERDSLHRENTALKEDAATISEYFKGVGEVNRTETGFVFKKWNGGADKEIKFEELKNYLPKKINQNAQKMLEADIKSLGKSTFKGEDLEKNIIAEANGYGIDERRNLLANKLKYMGNVSDLTDEQVDTNFVKLFRDNVLGAVEPERVDVLGVSERNRADAIAGVTKSLENINKIKPTYFNNKLRINNLPTGFRLEYIDYEDGTSKPAPPNGP